MRHNKNRKIEFADVDPQIKISQRLNNDVLKSHRKIKTNPKPAEGKDSEID